MAGDLTLLRLCFLPLSGAIKVTMNTSRTTWAPEELITLPLGSSSSGPTPTAVIVSATLEGFFVTLQSTQEAHFF